VNHAVNTIRGILDEIVILARGKVKVSGRMPEKLSMLSDAFKNVETDHNKGY
jgi:ABC-type transporter Mla maintaining outer membrane lipid asymmetry ATPase subunit MlaF